ncbi:type II secretion system GspH family protein [Undibacterium sp. Jales W-56]|uniref:type II secretion system protein n=1 Tax=Undibacterium sp. Jales W-56 TaxID=2897325 RepID=UPI0021D09F3E|nr:type II secretion system protein [Undibacterium sp. Jales W-56]MCU6433680.1 type II secretion system GspH family protein [Undibacterium sp. Jales W-56]
MSKVFVHINRARQQAGFSYLVALFFVAVTAILSLKAQSNMATNERRRKEDDLLYVGQAYRDAIRDYYRNAPGSDSSYPPNIDALLLDQRTSKVTRHLRKTFADPMTGETLFLLMSPQGGIMGVYSTSMQQPIKTDGFAEQLVGFAGAKTYQDWKFVYQPD